MANTKSKRKSYHDEATNPPQTRSRGGGAGWGEGEVGGAGRGIKSVGSDGGPVESEGGIDMYESEMAVFGGMESIDWRKAWVLGQGGRIAYFHLSLSEL